MLLENHRDHRNNLNRLAQTHLIRQNTTRLLKPLKVKPASTISKQMNRGCMGFWRKARARVVTSFLRVGNQTFSLLECILVALSFRDDDRIRLG
jgi:hypothetical protein